MIKKVVKDFFDTLNEASFPSERGFVLLWFYLMLFVVHRRRKGLSLMGGFEFHGLGGGLTGGCCAYGRFALVLRAPQEQESS